MKISDQLEKWLASRSPMHLTRAECTRNYALFGRDMSVQCWMARPAAHGEMQRTMRMTRGSSAHTGVSALEAKLRQPYR